MKITLFTCQLIASRQAPASALTCVTSRELSKPFIKSTVWRVTTDTTNIQQSTLQAQYWIAIYLSTTSPRRSRATIDSSVSRRWLCVAGCRMIWSRKIIRPKLYTLSTPFCCTYTRSCTATINQTWRYRKNTLHTWLLGQQFHNSSTMKLNVARLFLY